MTLPAVPSGIRLLGITGAPGAGKTTLAAALGLPVVPMDGFHYADAELVRRGLLDRKGAPETFDAEGYAALLRRVRTGEPAVVAPMFERDLEQPIAGAIPVPATGTVVTEGNYLLLDEPRWRAVRAEIDVVWHVEVDEAVRLERLVARHVAFGKTPAEAQAWVERVDQANAALVQAARDRADLVIDLTTWTP
ncbi:nucleoside/nucleotide kinase family protein [Nocardioides sp. LS1]|uniref:nucleoside/nucleotide kinase family protein n=1 Tax=Nocardioides sp. LS1 TaxID=1027620 RepID=UPI000F61E0DB|nr:nucleoside/nucleotide kinase family protein [Nocardioides sp. LS1]GCD91489.1 nucleoside/nucleotide kinase family protein [Nocardioides sp. LS1]